MRVVVIVGGSVTCLLLQLYNCFHGGGKLIAVRVTDYLKRNVLMHSWKNTVLLSVASRKKGEHLETCPK